MLTSNVVVRGKSTWPSASKVTDDRVFRSIRSHSRVHRDEELSDACSAIAESETTNLASELEVSIYEAKNLGQGRVNLVEVLQYQEEQQKSIDELRL